MPYVLFHTYCDDVGPILYALCPIPYPLRKYALSSTPYTLFHTR